MASAGYDNATTGGHSTRLVDLARRVFAPAGAGAADGGLAS
jgi:hypothetical protein